VARQFRPLFAGLTLGVVLSVAGCGGSAPAPAGTATTRGDKGPARGGSLTATIRSEPATFNRYAPNAAQIAVEIFTRLTQATLVRVNRLTGEAEPWLATGWTTSKDGRTLTFTLRDGLLFSDGVPLTSADVVFSVRALYDPAVHSALASGIVVEGKPLQVSAPDARTVVMTLPAPFAPAAALLDNVPIYPKHLLEAALDAQTFATAWGQSTKPSDMAGAGPFVLSEYVPGQRLTFDRNPHFWRTDASGVQLPYLDHLVMEIVKAQDAEILRLQAGTSDLMALAEVRPEDISALRKLRDQGALQIAEPGIGVDPDSLWFNLTPAAEKRDAHTRPYLHRVEFRQAISYAVDREAIANTLYLGAAIPISGPVTPGNRTWFSSEAPTYGHDVQRAKDLLASIGLVDRNHDGTLEDAAGKPVHFSILTQAGHIREKVATVIQAQLKAVGITVDVVSLDPPSLFQHFGSGDYESMYYGFQASALDPALNLDFWRSGGSSHWWNPEQKTPATSWERDIDALMRQQAAAPDLKARQAYFAQVQQIFAMNLPQIYFVAPKVTIAMSRRVGGAVPVLLEPKVLWQAGTIYVR
jgi:peptide/nickel transport system substrate-binding protein